MIELCSGGGLFRKFGIYSGDAPTELTEAVINLRNWPNSMRVIDEATDVADRIFERYLKPGFFTNRQLIIFKTDKNNMGIEYSFLPGFGFQRGHFLSRDNYVFYTRGNEEDEIRILREDCFIFDEDGKYFFEKKLPIYINFLKEGRTIRRCRLIEE